MSTAFGGNQVGSRVSLDIAGSYPTGLMAALGRSYNDQQLLINAQLRYTAAQVDINSQQDSAYASYNIQKERTATIAASSLENQIAAIVYTNASSRVNDANQDLSDDANVSYTKANAIYKLCCDASYSAHLSVEAASLVIDRVNNQQNIASLGRSTPDINPIDTPSISHMSTMVGNVQQDAHNATILAQTNALEYLFKTQGILGNAIVKSRTVTINLSVTAAFNTLVRAVIKNLADPLHYIAGKELLVTQYVPSPPLENAINVTNNALTCIDAFIQAVTLNQNTSPSIISGVTSATSLASTLDAAARLNDKLMYNSGETVNALVKSASTMRSYGASLSFPSEYTLSPTQIYTEAISVANGVKKVALHADISAVNARTVSNALIYLQRQFLENTTPDLTVSFIAKKSLKILNTAMETVRKVTSNSSAYSAVAITLRASNTLNGLLAQISADESSSLSAYSDANSVLTLLNTALSATVIVDISKSQSAAWAVNAAMDRAKEVSEIIKNKALVLSRTAHNLVTPQTIAIQTASANRSGALNNNYLSRLDRNSRNPLNELKAFKPFQAEIRAQTFQPVRPTLDELVYKNRITPLVPNSMPTITDTKVKVAQQVQRIKSASGFSYRQQ
jgi:hypothetical protein